LHFANLQKYASCHLCICLVIWRFYIVKIVGCRFGVQIQVRRAYFLQSIFHKIDNVECPFIFDKTKHLDNNNFNQFNVFWKIMVENAKHINFLPKPCNSVKLLVFLHNGLRIIKCNHLEKNVLQFKGLTWEQGKKKNSTLTNKLVRHTKCGLQHIQVNLKILLYLLSICNLEL
jgi:hypothetical protein